MWQAIGLTFLIFGVLAALYLAFFIAELSSRPRDNKMIVLTVSCFIVIAGCMDTFYPKKTARNIGVVAHKSYLPTARPDQSHYAIFVVRGQRHWLFRVSKQAFYGYQVNERVRLVTHRGAISGHTYKTTLHQSSTDYVHQ